MRRLFLITAALMFFVYVVSFATTIHVPADQPTIQAGINAAVNGDTVLVASGTYNENIDFYGRLITVISELGPDLTTISINQSGLPVVTFDNSETSDSRLEGFTIYGDLSYWGIYINASSPTIYNNVITTHEVGIYVNNSSGLIRRNEIINCQHSDISPNNGGGIRLEDCTGAVVDSNSIHDNSADVSAGIYSIYSNDITIERNLIYANDCVYVSGIKVDFCQNHLIRNNTIVSNTASDPIGAVLFYETDGIDIRNNIIAFNEEWGVYNWGASSDYAVDYNDIYGNTMGDIYGAPVGPGNIFLDPQFIDANGRDYNLSAGSPCINAGDPASPLDPDSSVADIGALYFPLESGFGNIEGTVTDRYGSPIEGVEVNVVGESFSDTTNVNGEYSITDLPAPASYDISFTHIDYIDTTVSGVFVNADITLELNIVMPLPLVIHVPDDYLTIQAAIDASYNGDSVLVSSGIYSEHIDFLGKAIVVKSEAGPDVTIIELVTSGLPVVTFQSGEGLNSVLQGFTIDGDYSYWGVYVVNASPYIYGNIIKNHEVGIRVDNGAPIIRRNEILACIHSDIAPRNGGAIRLYGCNGAVVDSNSIHDNYADDTGGIYSISCYNIAIERNLIYANSCIYVSGIKVGFGQNYVIRHNTVVGNTASDPIGALLFNQTDGIDIRNNIIAFNDEWGVYNWGASSDYTVDYNDFFGNTLGDIYGAPAGPGNVYLNPQFIDANGHDYNLSAGSPCIDAGDPDSPLDPDGSISDMGALYYGGGPGIYTLDIEEIFAEQGHPADISIIASGLSGQAIAGVEFHLLYDEACISFNEFSSIYLTDALVNVGDNEIHILWEDYQNPVYVDENAAILTLEFDVLADFGTECTIIWQEISELVDSIGDPIMGVSYLPGSILSTTLRNMAGAVRYFNSSLPVGGTDLSLSGFLEGETLSDTGGLYAFEDYPPGEYTISASRTGDDPGVTVNDIVLIRRHIVELELFTSPYQMIAADVNDNGAVSVADIIKIRRYLAELDDLPSGDWAFVDSAFTITFENWFEAPDYIDVTLGSDDITDLDFIGVRKGDVDNSWGSGFGSLICLDDSVSVSFNNVSCQPGENVTMPITVTGFVDVAGLEIHAEYPVAFVDVISINSDVMVGPTVNSGGGEIHFIWEDIDNLLTVSDNTEIILIEFEIGQDVPDTIPVTFVLTYVCDEFGDNFIVVEYDGFIITGPTAIGDDDNLPMEYSLEQNFPNPFNANTTLAFKLPYQSHVNLTVYDIQGRIVDLLLNEEMMAGTHQVIWNASDYPSGIYLYKLEAGNYSKTKKMILLK